MQFNEAKAYGFTLIELVIVVVLLGILSMTVTPKYIDLKTEATIGLLNDMQGSLKSSVKLVHAKALLKNQTVGEGVISVADNTINLHSGYPTGHWMFSIRYLVNLDHINFTPDPNEVCKDEWCGRGNQHSIPSGKTTTLLGQIVKIIPNGYRWNDQCGVYYINHADGRGPEIGVEKDDC